jgi:hypothetical protein
MFNSANQQTPKRNKGEKKELTVLQLTRGDKNQNNEVIGISKYLSSIILNINNPKSYSLMKIDRWLIEFTKIQLFVIWKRCTSLTVTDTDCK